MRELSERYGLAVRPDDRVEEIGVAQQQRVEILKALYRSARVLILDEPTAVLTPQEADELFAVIRSLREQGTSIIFISHKLNEVLEIADRITVLRRGQAVATVPAAGATEQDLAELMVGRAVLLRVEKGPAAPGEPLLEVSDLVVRDTAWPGGGAGAFAGGAGGRDRRHRRRGRKRPERAGRGDRRPRPARPPGAIEVGGQARSPATARRASFDAGIGHIPEDRQRFGLVLEFSLAENLALRDYRRAPDSTLRRALAAARDRPRAAAAGGVRRPRRRRRRRRPARSRAATSRRS